MKALVIVLVCVIAVVVWMGCRGKRGETGGVGTVTTGGGAVTTQELKALLAGPDRPFLLDVRSPGEFAAGHLEGAVLIPNYAVKGRLAELEPYRERPIVAYCESGARSASVARLLAGRGFRDVRNYSGGMRAWRKEAR